MSSEINAYRDLTRPPLRQRALSAALTAGERPAWRAVEVSPRTSSTNADLLLRAAAGEAEGLVITTDDQVGGKGRLGRMWTTPPRAALAVSVLLRPVDVPLARWPWVTLLGGLAVVDVLRDTCGLTAVLKWPNDVLVAPTAVAPGRIDAETPLFKICGILAEVAAGPEGPAGVSLGTGINVSQNAGELPADTATSLVLAGSAVTDRDTVLRAYLRALSTRYAAWRAVAGDPGAGLAAEYRRTCTTIGRRVRIEMPGAEALTGQVEGVDDEGRLLLRDDAGSLQALSAGDVVHVRPPTMPPVQEE